MSEIKKLVDEFKPKIRNSYGNRRMNLYKSFFERMKNIAYPPLTKEEEEIALAIGKESIEKAIEAAVEEATEKK
ncbi:MAG: hypothetical protein GY834_09870 [Bacteroidetes bacterium]|nr:hypothetical protein [Bacteroidota bacterium]